MTETTAEARTGRVEFTGGRQEMLGIILRGYALMLPTIGLYRFWQATWKRRFYWQNTVIDGEPIEYTGTASQLLLGFFFALAFFLPIYIAFFVLSMQDVDYILLGYAGVAALVWFMMGYAIYRARDFRLSRTLWRGIRFDLRGNAFAYGLRRFLWSILNVLTLGLIYPWMGASLWRYRWGHTWYGDRKFEISGNWKTIAGPYYSAYALNLISIGATVGWITSTADFTMVGNVPIPGPIGLALCVACVLVLAFSLAFYRTRVASGMLSTVSVGEAKLTVKISTGALFGQFVIYVVALIGLLILLALTALIALGGVYASAAAGGQTPDAEVILAQFSSGTTNVVLLIITYLVVLGAFGMLAELILGFGWWKLIARGAAIANPDSLRTVLATAEDKALVGQGLADALNVGGVLMEFIARYQDGKVGSVREVICIIDLASDPVMLAILDAASREIIDRWPADECYLLHSRMMELRIANRQRPAGARLAVTGLENMKAALGVLPKLSQHQRADYWKQVRTIGLATAALLSVIVAYLYGIPLLADRLVTFFPPEWEEKIGATADAQIEASMTEGKGYVICETNQNSVANKAITRFTDLTFAGLNSPFKPTVTVIRSNIPNAFALPGGRTYYLSSLIQASRSPDEFAGVLAHELGHVYYRHGMQGLIASSTTGLLVGFVLGDMTGLSVAGAIGASLIDNRFSRQSEAQADDFAGKTAQRLGFSPAGLVDLLDRVAKDDAFSKALALFSNHPLTDERRKALEALDTHDPGARPAFSDEEWAAIRNMCPPPPPPPLPAIVTPAEPSPLMRILVRTSKWAVWARRFGALALPLAAIPVLLHRGHLITSDNFVAVEGVAIAIAAAAVAMAFVAFVRLWFTGDQGWGRASFAFVFDVICLLPAAFFAWQAASTPASPDVSTDFSEPPTLVSFVESRFIGPEERDRIEAAYPNARSRTYPIEAPQMFDVVGRLIDDQGWDVRASRAPLGPLDAGQYNAVVTTLLGFSQEVAVRVGGSADGATIDMRSTSLSSFPDFGENGKRVEDFLLELDNQVTLMLRNAPTQAAPADD